MHPVYRKKMNFKPISTLLLLCLMFSLQSLAQKSLSGNAKRALEEADILYNDDNYLRALAIYDSLLAHYPSDEYLTYQTGRSLIHKSTGRAEAFNVLKTLQGNPDFPEIEFYMARAKHLDYEFEDAIALYESYLENGKPTGTMRILTLKYLEQCAAGIELMERRLGLSLEILSPPSNDRNSQYSPVISADGKYLFYTNRGPDSKGELRDDQLKKSDVGNYYEDVFVAEKVGADSLRFDFSEGRSISDSINSFEHEAPMSISYDGKTLFIYQSGKDANEDIYYSEKINDSTWSETKLLKGPVNSVHWEGHAALAPDGTTLYFSSDRPGGLGGRDIYKAIRNEDGSFGNVQNMGPKVNTIFNEDAPFIYSNGSSLYFASEGRATMGGYDIFYTKYDSAKAEWQEPVNMGYPLNTTDDDRFYYVSSDGEWGYFSSARASGENLHDIYRIRPGTFERLNSLILLVGTVMINDVEGEALAKIMDEETGKVIVTLLSDSVSGEFAYSLLPSRRYKISIIKEGFLPTVEYIDVPDHTSGFMKIEHTFYLYSEEYLALNRDLSGIGLQDELDAKLKEQGQDGSAFSYKGLIAEGIDPHREYLTDAELEAGYYFRVQVGAYRNPGKFKYEFLRHLGQVDINGYPDGITRYLMGQKFTKRSEAEKLRMECVMAGQTDAWITVRR